MKQIKDMLIGELAAYYFWDDFQAFEQAILVAKDNPVNMNEIERWSIVENYQDKF
jgi:hypothetical protein